MSKWQSHHNQQQTNQLLLLNQHHKKQRLKIMSTTKQRNHLLRLRVKRIRPTIRHLPTHVCYVYQTKDDLPASLVVIWRHVCHVDTPCDHAQYADEKSRHLFAFTCELQNPDDILNVTWILMRRWSQGVHRWMKVESELQACIVGFTRYSRRSSLSVCFLLNYHWRWY